MRLRQEGRIMERRNGCGLPLDYRGGFRRGSFQGDQLTLQGLYLFAGHRALARQLLRGFITGDAGGLPLGPRAGLALELRPAAYDHDGLCALMLVEHGSHEQVLVGAQSLPGVACQQCFRGCNSLSMRCDDSIRHRVGYARRLSRW
jgi:hypothetical protein